MLICGRTGSGKSTDMADHLSRRSYDVMPWVICDFKPDDVIAQLPITEQLSLDAPPPVDPGLYVVRVAHDDVAEGGRLDRYFRAVHAQGNIGIAIDEARRLGQRHYGFRLLLTEGRQRRIPMIMCTQRCFYIDTFAMSESEYIQVFQLQHPDDQARIESFVPPDAFDFMELAGKGMHWSYWYDTRQMSCELLPPCPPIGQIAATIRDRLPEYEDPYAPKPAEVRARL
jgi:DNA helicase HerA-like ATPase